MKPTLLLALWLCSVVQLAESDSESYVIEVDNNNFEKVVGSGNFLVEFYGPDCKYCDELEASMKETAKIFYDEDYPVKLARCDIEYPDNHQISQKYRKGMKFLPLVKYFKNGDLENPQDYRGPRTTQEMVEELRAIMGPPTVHITSKDQNTGNAEAETLVIGIFEKEGDELAAFSDAADKLREYRFKFLYSFDSDLIEECSKEANLCSKPKAFLLVGFERELKVFEGSFETETLSTWIVNETIPKLPELHRNVPRHMKHYDAVSRESKARAMIFSDKEFSDLSKLKKELIELQAEVNEITLFYIAFEDNIHYANFIGIKKKMLPAVVIEGSGVREKFVLENFKTVDEIKSFIAKYKANDVQPFFKSEDPPETDEGPVKVVVGTTLKDVISSGKNVLLEFYAPGCHWCNELEPTYEKVGKYFKGHDRVLVAKFDASANDIPDPRFQVNGYPTVKFVTNDGNIFDYRGDRSFDDLVRFVQVFLTRPGGGEGIDRKEEL